MNTRAPTFDENGLAGRTRPGVGPNVRRARAGTRVERSPFQIVVGDRMFDGHEDREVPPEVKAAFVDVFGRDRMQRIRLYFHPIFKRWMMMQKLKRPDGYVFWECVYIFSHNENLDDDHVPEDWARDPQLRDACAHMGGMVGEYREPTRADFMFIMEWSSTHQHGETAQEMEGRIARKESFAASQRESDRESFDHDWLSYRDRMGLLYHNDGVRTIMNTSDIREGSRWSRLRELASHNMELHPSGFWIRSKKTSAEREEFMKVWGERLERAGQQEAKVLMDYLERQREGGVDMKRPLNERELLAARQRDKMNDEIAATVERKKEEKALESVRHFPAQAIKE